jgi:hypothetical protein
MSLKERVYNNCLIGAYSVIIVLVLNGIFQYLVKDIEFNVLTFIGVLVYLGTSIFVAGYFVNKVVLNKHYE